MSTTLERPVETARIETYEEACERVSEERIARAREETPRLRTATPDAIPGTEVPLENPRDAFFSWISAPLRRPQSLGEMYEEYCTAQRAAGVEPMSAHEYMKRVCYCSGPRSSFLGGR